MKNKKIFYILDWLLWTLILLMPLMLKSGFVADIMTSINQLIPGIENSFLMEKITDLFNFLDIETNAPIYYIICWFIMVEFVHLVIDILLFIPRYFHKIMEKGLKDGE